MEKYKIGWYNERQKRWHYIIVNTREELIAEVADKTCLSDKVSIRKVKKEMQKEKR